MAKISYASLGNKESFPSQSQYINDFLIENCNLIRLLNKFLIMFYLSISFSYQDDFEIAIYNAFPFFI